MLDIDSWSKESLRKKRLLWQVFPCYLLITLVALLAVTWYASRSMRRFYMNHIAVDLEARARLVEKQVLERIALTQEESVDSLCKNLGKKASTRITVILPSGRVIGDSEEDPARMDNHGSRAEVRDALAGETGTSVRFSPTLKQRMMYVALPLRMGNETVGVVRTSIPVTSVYQIVRAIQIKIALGGLVIAIFAAAMSLIVSRRISRPLEEMKEGAERFARGELQAKLRIPDSEELASLAQAMNEMAFQLDSRIRLAVQQRSELEAVLSSMVEGVLAVTPRSASSA